MKFNLFVEELLNGLAIGKSLDDVAKKHNVSTDHIKQQLEKGIKVETEHTKENEVAKKIAMDHLFEDPDYYTKLSKIEKGA